MASILNHAYDVEVPPSVQDFESFRRWTHSDAFPESGRIDYVNGHIEVDMSPEDLFTHGTVKGEISGVLHRLIREAEMGHLFVDSTRIASVEAGLSAEPDIVFLSHDNIGSGKVQFVPKASREPDRYVEIEGGPDLIVEVVSDSSTKKDAERLPKAYFVAGVREYWLVDVRTEKVSFEIYQRGEAAFEPMQADVAGFRPSHVFNKKFRLDRTRNERSGMLDCRLIVEDVKA